MMTLSELTIRGNAVVFESTLIGGAGIVYPNARKLVEQFFVATLLATLLLAGCAIHYFDPYTGTEHLWGIGHLKMKVTPVNEGVRGVVRGVEMLGLGIGRDGSYGYVALGWHNHQRLDILDDDTSIRLEWCGNDFANVRVGSEFPESLEGVEPKEVHISRNKESDE